MKWGKGILVVLGALVITALGIDAADTLGGSKGTLLSQVISSGNSVCPSGMVEVKNVPTITCVDAYEASTGKKCGAQDPGQVMATQQNIESRECVAESKVGAMPWRFVTRDQAMQLCARDGKRLPTSAEWYTLGLGMANVENSCNVSSKVIGKTGNSAECSSPDGVYDLVGNVWEWVSDDVIDGNYNGVQMPDTGYVSQVDATGMAVLVSEEAQELFGKDYFWSRKDGAYAVIRGGYYDSGTDSGLYTVHADTPPTTSGTGIGFRCVR